MVDGKVWHMHEVAEKDLLEQQVSLMGELAHAIENHELEVQYQPKLDLKKNQIASVEALIRWHHPTRGYLSPDTFIPLAEKSDHIADMTLFVLQRTLRDLAQWRSAGLEVKGAGVGYFLQSCMTRNQISLRSCSRKLVSLKYSSRTLLL